jgi:ribosomal protein S18 acetylase RimI-like enzyme
MSIREATTEDVQKIKRVAAEAWHAAHDDIIGESAVDDFLSNHYNDDDIKSGISAQNTLYYVAEDDTEGVVGFVAGGPWRDSDTTYVIGAIYVLPAHWGKGFGSSLIERFEGVVKTRGGAQVRLVVMAENEVAINFYESAGYERTDDHYADSLNVNGYVYTKDLK